MDSPVKVGIFHDFAGSAEIGASSEVKPELRESKGSERDDLRECFEKGSGKLEG